MYRNSRFIIRFVSALFVKYRSVILFGVILGAVSYIFLPSLLSRIPPLRYHRSIGIIGRFSLLNLPLSIQEKISIGLTTLDPSGIPSPGLAESWQSTDSGKTYIFKINPSYKWQNNSSVSSSDIKYNFRDIVMEYPDPETLVIRLNDAFSPLPSVVSRPVILTKRVFGLFPKNNYLGTGAYRISSYRFSNQYLESLTLTPCDSSSRLPSLNYRFYFSTQQAITAFKLGLVDHLEAVNDTLDLSAWNNVNIVSQPQYDRYVGVFFNTQSPDFSGVSGKNLRLSLSYSIDKSRWPDRALGPISNTSWAYNPEIKSFDYDLDKSLANLKKVEKIPENLVISTLPAYLTTAEQIKSDWEKIGIKSEIHVQPEIPDDFQVLLIAQAIPSDPDQYHLWHSTQGSTNLSRLHNPRIDKLLEDGRKTESLTDRTKIYSDFQKYLVEEAPVIFLYYPKSYNISRGQNTNL